MLDNIWNSFNSIFLSLQRNACSLSISTWFHLIVLLVSSVSLALGFYQLYLFYFHPQNCLPVSFISDRKILTEQMYTSSEVLSEQNTIISAENQDKNEEAQNLFVSITGAVQKPGIVELQVGSRWAQALDKVGGPVDKADIRFLNQEFNGAKVVKDGEQIYIPFQDEAKEKLQINEDSSSPQQVENNNSENKSQDSNEGLTSINSAKQKELENLEGIGEKRAQDIMGGRPYSTIHELVERGILTEKIFAEIQNSIEL